MIAVAVLLMLAAGTLVARVIAAARDDIRGDREVAELEPWLAQLREESTR